MTDLYEIYNNNNINLMNDNNIVNDINMNDIDNNNLDLINECNDINFFTELGIKDINLFLIDLSIKNSRLFRYFISGSPFVLSKDYNYLQYDTINIKNNIVEYDKKIIKFLDIYKENIDKYLRNGEQYNTEDNLCFIYVLDRNNYNNNIFQICKDYLEIIIKYLTNFNHYEYEIILQKNILYQRFVVVNYYINLELNNNNLVLKYFYIIRPKYNDYINHNKLTYEWYEFEKTLDIYKNKINQEFNKYNSQDIITLEIYNKFFQNKSELELKIIPYYKLKNYKLNIELENRIREILIDYLDIPSYKRYFQGYIFRFYGSLVIGNDSCISFILNKDFI